ncbi:hypothetical protein J2X46_004186 [Nocardioides sp. BE266]|uniref:hypothetical protein n=1 Tax=Nocardioides sp. BE266 TaxID=2817725 RepID=UPI002865E53D|nr:hypothetical protein [Nocardioides sp. BE266]MDR7255184.1 hypothetical protein [Nocardioides sp. BE266]
MDPRRLLPVLAAVAAACVVATLVVGLARPGDAPAAPRREAAVPRSGPAVVLAEWDERRAAAWAAGDVTELRSLYADGSRTGAADAKLLRHYLARGLRVEGLTTQVLALEVVDQTGRRLVLEVTDRVVGGSAVGGPTPIALPADRASTRRVVLVRPAERWLVAEVREGARDQANAAASTSRTSSSSKS